MKNMKKLTAMLLTLVMSLALAVPCFAAAPQEGSGEDTVYLEVGDTVTTASGLTVTLKKADETDALSAARVTKSPITSTKTWTSESEFSDSGTCRKINGDMLGFDIVNTGARALTMEVWVNWSGVAPDRAYENFYCSINDEGPYTLLIENVFNRSNTVNAEWSVMPTNTGRVHFTISA